MQPPYSIRDLAQEFNVTPRALRFYEEKGLLQPTRVKQSRSYSNADRTRLKLILRGKRLGLTLEESSDIILLYNPAGNKRQIQSLVDKIQEKKAQLLQQQQDIESMLQDLQESEQRCLTALAETDRN